MSHRLRSTEQCSHTKTSVERHFSAAEQRNYTTHCPWLHCAAAAVAVYANSVFVAGNSSTPPIRSAAQQWPRRINTTSHCCPLLVVTTRATQNQHRTTLVQHHTVTHTNTHIVDITPRTDTPFTSHRQHPLTRHSSTRHRLVVHCTQPSPHCPYRHSLHLTPPTHPLHPPPLPPLHPTRTRLRQPTHHVSPARWLAADGHSTAAAADSTARLPAPRRMSAVPQCDLGSDDSVHDRQPSRPQVEHIHGRPSSHTGGQYVH